MAELGILPQSGINIPAFNPLPPSSYFDKTPAPAPAISTAALSRSQGKVAVMGALADMLNKLPETMISAYDSAKKRVTGQQTVDAYNAALTGKPPAGVSLADFKASSDGSVTFSPADAEMRRLKLEALRRSGLPKPKAPTLWEQEAGRMGLQPGDIAAPVGPEETAAPKDELEALPDIPDPRDDVGFNPTDAQRSEALLPPAGFQPTPKPQGRPLGQLSNFPDGVAAPVAAATPMPAQATSADPLVGYQPTGEEIAASDAGAVQPEMRDAIAGAAQNIGGQLTQIQPSDMGAGNPPVTQAVKPVSQEEALATFGAVPPAAAAAPAATPAAGKKTIDRVTGIITLTTGDGRQYQLLPHANAWKEAKPQAGTAVPANIRSEAVRMNVWKEGMTGEQAAKAMEDKQITDGVIPPHLLPQAQSLARLVVSHPSLKHYPTIREAKEAVDAGLAHPDTGGFSDMALVEGFQRMINPGATVRAQTIQSMMDAAGFMQKFDPSFIWNKAVQGDKFSPEARQRIKKLSDDIFERSTKNAEPQLKALGRIAKSYGISKPEEFVNNVLVMSPLYDAGGTEVPLNPPGATGVAPAGATDPKDIEAVKWIQANPTDPRTAKIKAALQARGVAVQ